MNLYILDACALVALLQDEPGADMVGVSGYSSYVT